MTALYFIMTRTLITSYLLLLCLFCFAQDNFEGIVSYAINLEIKENAENFAEYYGQKYGDILNVHYASNGNQYFKYVNSGDLGLDWAVYLVDENEYYAKWKSMDSIFYYSCDTNMLELLSFETLEKANISERQCDQYRVESMATKGLDVEFLTKYWYFNDELPFDGEIYSDYKDERIDSIYSISNSHPIAWKSDLKHIIVDFKLIKIEDVKLDHKVFELPKDIKLVNF